MRKIEKNLRERLKKAEEDRDKQKRRADTYGEWIAARARGAIKIHGEGKNFESGWLALQMAKILAEQGEGWRI